jgi:hypothetical protein
MQRLVGLIVFGVLGLMRSRRWRYAGTPLPGGIGNVPARKESNMLWTIFVVLLVLWGLGLMTGYTLGGVIHALLVIAIIVVLIQFIQGRRRL